MLILDDPTTWPSHIVEKLNAPSVVSLLKRHTSMDDVADAQVLRDIFVAVQEFATSDRLAAYHCTKQLPTRPYTETGLRILDFETHHSDFLDILRGHELVDAELLSHIDKVLRDFQANHTGQREKMLCFCLNRHLVLDSGTELLFKYFGGEAIYCWFKHDPRVAPLLEDLGEPVVVEARISVSDLTVFLEFALGRTLVSYFANSINPAFVIEGLDGYVSSNVPPSDIVAVHPHGDFVAMIEHGS